MIATEFSEEPNDDNNTSEADRKTIEPIRNAPSYRRVQGGSSNVRSRFPSKRVDATIQFESHALGLSFIYALEHNDDFTEYYDQSPAYKIAIKNEGQTISREYTPDFFVIHENPDGSESSHDIE
jgi:hypothetical protein